MFRKVIFSTLFVIIFLNPADNKAQFNDYGIKGGVQGFGLLGETDFNNDEIGSSFLAKAFLRIDIIKEIDFEIGGGFGRLSGEDQLGSTWETSIIPVDIRLMVSPFDFSSLNPYVYVGGGYMKWTVDTKPKVSSSGSKSDGYDPYSPLGLGIEIKLTNSLLLDVSGGYNFAFSDNLDYLISGDHDDSFWNFGIGLVFTGESGKSDSDLDGLTLNEEKIIGTNPEIPDTDNDGLLDGLEFNRYKTDPLVADTDGDGLLDSEEIENTTTDPLLADTDMDGISDGEEIGKFGTDPLREDTDFDGITDNNEIVVTETDPTVSDTDMDGLKDGDEIIKYNTSPLELDSDSDGLLDGDEVLKYNTNPSKADTDDGGANDKVEVDRGTNPLNPEDDTILDIESPIVLEGVTFATGSSDLTPESEKVLLQVLNTLNAYPDLRVEIRGFTDNVGKAASNQALSQRRANSVRYWILNKGIDPERVVAKGYGENNPIAENNTKEGRRLNRRIEFSRID